MTTQFALIESLLCDDPNKGLIITPALNPTQYVTIQFLAAGYENIKVPTLAVIEPSSLYVYSINKPIPFAKWDVLLTATYRKRLISIYLIEVR